MDRKFGDSMKIGIISEYFPQSENLEIRGGIEARTYHLSRNLARSHDVVVIAARENGNGTEDEVQGVQVLRVGRSKEYTQTGSLSERLNFIRDAVEIGKKQDFDIVEGTNFLSYPVAWKIGASLGIPRVITYHDVWINRWMQNIGFSGIFGEVLERYTRAKVWDLIVAVSNYTRDNLQNQHFKADHIVTIYNGIDIPSYRQIQAGRYAAPTICTVARLVKYKRIDLLISALALVKEQIPDVVLKIVGSGPEEANLRSLVQKLDLQDAVEFLGFVKSHDDVKRILAASDVFTLSSTVEGFGIVVIEALASGTPYVASDIPPIREITEGGKGGQLFRPNDATDLAEKLIAMLEDEGSRRKAVQGIDEHIRRYDWATLAGEVEQWYWVLMDENRILQDRVPAC
ncbi:MAG: glycosyltransferase family 4 protein [Methanoculleus sp.]|nr:glycosyltransferase family 4 protein [Methanoculleus sp.]